MQKPLSPSYLNLDGETVLSQVTTEKMCFGALLRNGN